MGNFNQTIATLQLGGSETAIVASIVICSVLLLLSVVGTEAPVGRPFQIRRDGGSRARAVCLQEGEPRVSGRAIWNIALYSLGLSREAKSVYYNSSTWQSVGSGILLPHQECRVGPCLENV